MVTHRQAHITSVNGTETSALEIGDRGLSYGDGLFETMRVIRGKVPLLQYHVTRFVEGLERLNIGSVRRLKKQFQDQVNAALPLLQGEAILKIIVTRGHGGRGYVPPGRPEPSLILQAYDYPDWPRSYFSKGIDVVRCSHRLSSQPALAGIKHLNRLDQVLASAELGRASEGLMCDQQGRYIEGTKSNLLVFMPGRVLTPAIVDCGVKGALRAFLLEHQEKLGLPIEESGIDEAILAEASGLAMFNGVFGVWPVKSLDGRIMALDPNVRRINAFLNQKLDYSLPV